uniref:SSD domain-containing protein n=1 Tax=Meloidogyne incognita TaxID=6306 RepID=A0A914LZ35_MELIC
MEAKQELQHTKLLEGSSDQTDTLSPRVGNPEGPKLVKFFNFWEQFNLENGFKLLGHSIGVYPLAFLIASLILSSLSVGIYWLEIKDRVRDGYTPTTSMSRYETDVLKEFLGSTGDPLLTTVLIRARDGGSMHRLRWLNASVNLHSLLHLNISADLDGESVYYSTICGPFCDANVPINYFYESLNSQLTRLHAGKRPSNSLNLTYPISRVNGFDLHLERNFYGVKLRNINESRFKEDPEVSQLSKFTNIEHIEAIMMTFRADISHPKDEEKMARWEMRVYEFSQNQFNNSLIEMLVLGSEIVDYEMAKEAEKTVPYFVMGFLFMFAFVIYTLLIGAFFYGVMDRAKPLLALGVSLCPVLAITSTFGACTLAGYRTNSVILIMPFLICGIGVNDAFLMAHSWNRTARKHLPIPERLGIIFEEVGPSITITTLTNVVTFLIGALTPTPEISLFCLATAVALGFAYIYTLMLFAPLIYFASIFEESNSGNNTFAFLDKIRHEVDSLFNWILKIYCKIISNRIFGFLLLFGVLIYWYFALAGTLNIQAKLDTEKILPRSSPILQPHKLISHMVWTEYYPLTILVNNPIDIRLRGQFDRFNTMLEEFEGLKFCKGKQFTILWLRDYIEYCKMAALYDFDFFDNSNNSSEMHIDSFSISETGFDYTRLEQFLSSPFYKHYISFLRFSSKIKRPITGHEFQVPISKFWFSVTYHNTVSWEERINLMQEWRAVAENYPDLNVTVWEVNSMFVDQMLSLKSLTLQVCKNFLNPSKGSNKGVVRGSILMG